VPAKALLRFPRHSTAASALLLASLASLAQTASPDKPPAAPAPVAINRNVILLDPAHGGVDSGSRIGDSTLEKDVTLAVAFKLRSLLSARGLTVVMTRDADTPTEPNAAGSPLTLDDRAGIANHSHAVACLLLHATGSGKGVHLYDSELEPTAGVAPVRPWLTAQAPWVSTSHDLSHQVAGALRRSGFAVINSSASIRPVDSLECPALVVELAPETDDPDSINNGDYQQRVALAIAGSLFFWPSHAQPPSPLPAPEPQP
jgi:N-acetylmuramoyl-L-alanine amidase